MLNNDHLGPLGQNLQRISWRVSLAYSQGLDLVRQKHIYVRKYVENVAAPFIGGVPARVSDEIIGEITGHLTDIAPAAGIGGTAEGDAKGNE